MGERAADVEDERLHGLVAWGRRRPLHQQLGDGGLGQQVPQERVKAIRLIRIVQKEIVGAQALLRLILLHHEVEVIQENATHEPTCVLEQAAESVHELAMSLKLSLLLVLVIIFFIFTTLTMLVLRRRFLLLLLLIRFCLLLLSCSALITYFLIRGSLGDPVFL